MPAFTPSPSPKTQPENNMSVTLKVYNNGDHTCLVWIPNSGQAIHNCRGFAISRKINGVQQYLHGFTGFASTDKPVAGPSTNASDCLKFPIQRYMWWDYYVKAGDKVQYSIVPIVGPDKDHLSLDPNAASAVSAELTVTSQFSPHISAYFNKGIVAAQWVSAAVAAHPSNQKLADVVAESGNALRNELSGSLRPAILDRLAQCKKDGGQIYAALYELKDKELIDALVAFGKDCHLILANGAFKPPTNDENIDVRKPLRAQVDLSDRLVSTGHFAHNKIVIFCDSKSNPTSVLTGSTNWTPTGLCTQANNTLIIDDPKVAAAYKAYWDRIKKAGNGYADPYIPNNSTAVTTKVDGASVTPWCVPTDGKTAPDLAYARKLISAAKEGILFLFFNPGTFQSADAPLKWTLLQNILTRHHPDASDYDPNLYIRGVVNQDIADLTFADDGKEHKSVAGAAKGRGKVSSHVVDPSNPSPVSLFTGGNKPPEPYSHDVLVPAAIKDKFDEFQKENLGAGVHVHSKVIIVDPFGENPVVITGSHNLGYKASSKNDDNLIIIEGNNALAAAYAVNIIAIFQNYRWNHYVEAHRTDPKAWHGLQDNDQWQSGHLAGDELAELKFWFGGESSSDTASGTAQTATPPAPAAGSPAASLPVPGRGKGSPKKRAVAKAPVAHKKPAAPAGRGTKPKKP